MTVTVDESISCPKDGGHSFFDGVLVSGLTLQGIRVHFAVRDHWIYNTDTVSSHQLLYYESH